MHNTHGYASSLYEDNHSLLVTTSAVGQDSPINANVLHLKARLTLVYRQIKRGKGSTEVLLQ